MQTISSKEAAELIFNLFQRHQWLLAAGQMQADDAQYETEALRALLTLNEQTRWQNISQAAQRVACYLLLDFLTKTTFPNHPYWQNRTFEIDPSQSEDRQAFALIAAEILRNHPHLKALQ